MQIVNFQSISINFKARKIAEGLPHCPLEVRASDADNAMGSSYFSSNKEEIMEQLRSHGAVWFRGFDLMKSVKGHRLMHEELGLTPCLDPLHSSGLRKFASERDALYEEVNKPSLRNHYIGLHSESTTKRTAAYAAFVCFQRATEGGGRFLVADGAKILAELEPKLAQKLYDRKVRISVSNLDLPGGTPPPLKDAFKKVVEMAVAPKFDMDLEMIYESDGKQGRLQAVEELVSLALSRSLSPSIGAVPCGNVDVLRCMHTRCANSHCSAMQAHRIAPAPASAPRRIASMRGRAVATTTTQQAQRNALLSNNDNNQPPPQKKKQY